MSGEETYDLYIDAFTPATISMSRLAEYMACFSDLLGNKEHVHFEKLNSGSLSIAARAESVAQRKVEQRIYQVRYRLGPQAARKAFKDIDDKLAVDNAVGHVVHGKEKLIEFPGRRRPVDSTVEPIVQAGTLDGEVIQIGGRDETINIHLKTGDYFAPPCVTSKVVARRLAVHLFGAPIRVRGTGTWARSGSGAWILKKFEIEDFSTLDETPLTKMFEGLRSRLVPPEGGRMNPVELMRQLREE